LANELLLPLQTYKSLNMEFLQSKFFWGVVVVLIGLSMILNDVFKINLPLFKIIIAVFFIYLGVRIMSGTFSVKGGESASVFGDNRVRIEVPEDLSKEYSAIFGSQTIDLSDMKSNNETDRIQVNVVFGSTRIIVHRDQRVKMKVNSVLGSAHAPSSSGNDSLNNVLYIEGNVVLGDLKVRRH
jgi:predicted membrane protein